MENLTESLAEIALGLLISISLPCGAQTWTQKGGTLSADPSGWAFHPSIAASADGTLYAAWAQHTNPGSWELVSPHGARYSSGSWQPLGGRIGNAGHEGYSPSIVVVGTTPYVAWYEGEGWGWSIPTSSVPALGDSVFVAHWNGSQWAYDYDYSAMPNGALNTTIINASSDTNHAHHPVLTSVNGTLYAAWIELRGMRMGIHHDVVVVKHLSSGQWARDGTDLTAVGSSGSKITDATIADIGGIPCVAWSEFKRTQTTTGSILNSPGTVQVYCLSSSGWTQLGGVLNISSQGYSNFVALTGLGSVPYVAWQERPANGKNQIYVKHWNGSSWAQDVGSLNVDAVNGEAGRPALTNDGTRVWLAWAEGAPGQKSQLYARSLAAGIWSAPQGSLNVDLVNGSADAPGLAISAGVAQVIWSENETASATKQVYVKGNDSSGVAVTTTLSPWGNNGPTVSLPPNTWINLQPGGIANGSGVGNEGYNSFSYDPGIGKAMIYGQYHTPTLSSGEDQNALLGYDFKLNRWDVLEAGESSWSEQWQGVGHDEGQIAIDPVNDLYISHGDLTENTGVVYKTYVYDLKARRGQRMMPPVEMGPYRTDLMSGAFASDQHLALMVGHGSGWLYDPSANTWSPVPNTPIRYSPGLVYDSKNHLFVMFGGELAYLAPSSTETWTFDLASKTWTQRFPANHPPSDAYPYMPFIAYDSVNGVTLLVGGNSPAVWVYDAAANTWTQLADLPSGAPFNQVDGAYLTYDSNDGVFLLYGSAKLTNVWAFKYQRDFTPPTRPQGLALE